MRLKKFLSAALSAAMLISCVSFGGGTVVQAAGEMNIARNLQISAYSGTEGDFPVSSVNDGRGDDTQNDNYRWFSKEALKGSGARGNAAYLIFDLGENGPRSFSGIDIRFHNMAYATNYKILTTDNSIILRLRQKVFWPKIECLRDGKFCMRKHIRKLIRHILKIILKVKQK